MKIVNTNNRVQRVTKIITTGALVAAPFLSVLPNVEAQPRWNQQGGQWTNNQNTLTGTVVRDLPGDLFELRMDNGRIFQVNVSQYREPRSLNRGDRVRITGWNRLNVFYARSIEFLRNTSNNGYYGNNGNYNQTTLTGVVTRDLSGDNFELRADNGRVYRVNVGRTDEPRSLDRGDRVRVTGRLNNNNVFQARDIDFLSDTPNGNYNQTTLTGVVTRDLSGNSFELRADNGRVYQVNVRRTAEPRSLDRGDRVRVTGRLNNDNVFQARDIDFLRDTPNGYYGNNGNYGNYNQTTLAGVVTRDVLGDNFELKTDSGRTVWVRLNQTNAPRSLDRGDRIRVTGRFTNNTFIASDLDILRDTPRVNRRNR